MDNAGDSFLAGIDRETGKNRWRIKRPRQINWITPIALDANAQTVLFQNGNEATAIDSQTGKVRWKLEGGFSTIPSSTQGEGLVFLTGGELKAVRPRQDGSAPEVVWDGGKVTGGYASPLYYKGRIYGLAAVNVVCLNASDGKEQWKQRMDGPFDASPVVADGKLYAVNRKGRTFVVELGDKPKIVARNDIDDTIQATPAIANGAIYLRSDKYLYAIGAKR
jgi:outer membrane protein assembly factor BamB